MLYLGYVLNTAPVGPFLLSSTVTVIILLVSINFIPPRENNIKSDFEQSSKVGLLDQPCQITCCMQYLSWPNCYPFWVTVHVNLRHNCSNLAQTLNIGLWHQFWEVTSVDETFVLVTFFILFHDRCPLGSSHHRVKILHVWLIDLPTISYSQLELLE